jgi:RNA polymerase sigma factor (sigma-70 family)
MRNVFTAKGYPAALRKAVSHAARLDSFLRRLESERSDLSHHLVERAGELRVVLHATVADWLEKRRDTMATREAIVTYLDMLHRTTAKTLRCGTTLECCRPDDAITTQMSATESLSIALSVALSAVSSPSMLTGGPTDKRWHDDTEVLARFHEHTHLVDQEARKLARRIPPSTATLDDLRTFAREGLLDAARTFDPACGVPFARWAALRIRSTILDGARQAAHVPRPAEIVAIAHGPDTPVRTPEDLLAAAQERARVPSIQQMLETLPDAQRKLLERMYVGGESLSAAAIAMGLPKVTASRMHARAIEALRSLVEAAP